MRVCTEEDNEFIVSAFRKLDSASAFQMTVALLLLYLYYAALF